MIFVDTNVIIDLLDSRGEWYNWSLDHLSDALLAGPALINTLVFAELCSGFAKLEQVETLVADLGLDIEPISHEALFDAGQAFALYRRSGGAKDNVLPDFLIGAHAAAMGAPLLTRDRKRYRTYFPTLELIAPDI